MARWLEQGSGIEISSASDVGSSRSFRIAVLTFLHAVKIAQVLLSLTRGHPTGQERPRNAMVVQMDSRSTLKKERRVAVVSKILFISLRRQWIS